MTTENTQLLFPSATPTDVTRENIKLQVAQSYRLIDTTDAILKETGAIDPKHAAAVIGAFKQQLEEMATLVAIQNSLTMQEFAEGVHALEHFYAEQIAQAAELLKQAEQG